MIPKIIHYCWFGPNPLPKKSQKCINSWKEFFPDFQFMFWNETNSPLNNKFVQEAIRNNKWAFVADFVRTWVLYNYGGIYLDTDILVIRDFNELLSEKVFLAYEQPEKLYVNVAVWGAEKNNKFVHEILNCYETIEFDIEHIFKNTIPMIVSAKLTTTKELVKVLDYDSFYPFPQKQRRYGNYKKYITPQTYAVHLWDFSWLTMKERIIIHLKMILSCWKK